jgi:hypothetical protein
MEQCILIVIGQQMNDNLNNILELRILANMPTKKIRRLIKMSECKI